MPITNKGHYRGNDFNNQELKDVKSLQINQDATSNDEAVRKVQAENISAQAAQDVLISLSESATQDTAFTSATMVGFLAGKQDNMSVHADSTSYLEIVDGYKIKAKQLLIQSVIVDDNSTLADYILTSPTNQEGDVVILTSATDNQERSWIRNGSSAEDALGYTRLQTDYNISSIRTMFSDGAYLSYDQGSGQFGLILGILTNQLGAQALPMDSSKFQVLSVAQDNQEKVNLALESYIKNVDTTSNNGNDTVILRLDNLSGVSGSDLGAFIKGIFSNNSDIKTVLQESETAHNSATNDRATIRSEVSSTETTLANSILTEKNRALSAESSEASARQSSDNTLQSNINNTNANLTSEETRATNAENALDTRLDTVEGGDTTVGSIAKAEKDAKDYAGVIVGSEANIRGLADANLQLQIDALQGAFQYKGYLDTNGRIQHVDPLNSNHNQVFENASFVKGEFYRINAAKTITFANSSTIEVTIGDNLVVLNSATAGLAVNTTFHKGENTEAADLLREGQLDNTHLERDSNVIKIKADSLGREKLTPGLEVDIDNKVLKSGDTMTGSLLIDKTIISGTGYVGGYDYAQYIKQKSVDTASLTNTQRALLVENLVYTNGSGDPLDLDYANAITSASHYNGSSNTMSVATVGINGEANVTSPSAAIYATGLYGVAKSSQLGVNVGGTFLAQNGETSNLGIFGFSDTAGATTNRAGYFALSTDAIDFDHYRVARVVTPLPVQDAALVVDDYTGLKHAIYANGKVEIGGASAKLIIPSATADNEAVNLLDIKNKEYATNVNVTAGNSVVINHQLNSLKIIPTLWLNNEVVTSGFKIERTSVNSITIYNNTAIDVTSLDVYLTKLSV